MITKDTAARIFSAYREIEAAEGLLKEIRSVKREGWSSASHQVPALRAHVEKKRAEIAELCEVARLELDRDF